MKTTTISKYEKAKQRVTSIREFYNHLTIYIIINILLYVLRNKFTLILLNEDAFGNPDFLQWIDWNVFGTTIIWGIVLAVHDLKVFSGFSRFTKEWEERTIQKYLNESGD